MKKELLTVKELAAELREVYSTGVPHRRDSRAVVTSYGAVRSRESPPGDGSGRTRPHASSQRQLDTAGRAGRRQPAARPAETPPLGNTGARV